MKRLTISIAIILLVTLLCGLHVLKLEQLTHELTEQLQSAEIHLSRKNWSQAQKIVSSISDEWERQAFYLHTTLRHTDIDAIRTSLKEVNAYLSSREDTAECLAAAAKLINQLELLLEAELPTIKNLL